MNRSSRSCLALLISALSFVVPRALALPPQSGFVISDEALRKKPAEIADAFPNGDYPAASKACEEALDTFGAEAVPEYVRLIQVESEGKLSGRANAHVISMAASRLVNLIATGEASRETVRAAAQEAVAKIEAAPAAN